MRRCRCAADALMCLVVEEDVDEIRRSSGTDGRHRAHVHEGCTVSVEEKDALRRAVEGDTESNRPRVPHRADGEKVMGVILAACLAQLKELASRLARGCDDDGAPCRIEDLRNGILAPQGIFICVFVFRMRERSLTDEERALSAGREMRADPLHPRSDILRPRRLREHHRLDAHRLEERQREASLYEMLRLVVEVWLAAPPNDKDARDAVDLLVEEGEQGIDDIAEPAVLQVDERHLARREMIARRECRRIPLIRRDDV